jgi:phosphatidylglycerophosphate synthase
MSSWLPAIVVVGYFLFGYAAFLIRCQVSGVPRDQEMETRGGSAMLGMHVRYYFAWITKPLWRVLLAANVPANVVTEVAAVLGLASGTAVAFGFFGLGGWMFIFSGILDAIDGRIARLRNEATRAGAALDSILDRYVDTAFLAGLGWYYRDSWVLLLVFLAINGTSVTPYVRAKGEALGISMRDGLMQRAERLVYLGVPVALSPIIDLLFRSPAAKPPYLLAIAGISVLAVTSNLTAITRFRSLLRALIPKS